MALRISKLPPIRVVACCSWFDEDPSLLTRMVASLPSIGVDTLVAVDGRYRLFGDQDYDDFRSSPEQHAALWAACAEHHVRLVSDLAPGLYVSEREKRQRLFSLAESYAQTGDWLLWIDGDEMVDEWFDPDRTISDHLRLTAKDAAEITFIDHSPDGGDTERYWQMPRLFRAGQFSKMGPNHYTLLRGDNSALWGNGAYREITEAVTLPLLMRHMARSADRADRERRFIQDRDRHEPEPERWDLHRSLSPDERKKRFPLTGSYEVRST